MKVEGTEPEDDATIEINANLNDDKKRIHRSGKGKERYRDEADQDGLITGPELSSKKPKRRKPRR